MRVLFLVLLGALGICASKLATAISAGDADLVEAWAAAAALGLGAVIAGWRWHRSETALQGLRRMLVGDPGADVEAVGAEMTGALVQMTEPIRRAAINQVLLNERDGVSEETAQAMALAFYEAGLNVLGRGDK